MTTKKKSAPAAQSISNCNFSVCPPVISERTVDAVIALAGAVKSNAEAIKDLALALKGADVRVDSMIRIEPAA